MAAYALFIREQTLDQQELNIYATKVRPILGKYSPRVLAGHGRHEVVEGHDVEGVIILSFPNVELAKRWYHSPEYQEAVKHRLKGGRYHGIIVDAPA
jgi:uncharacterized protein (DUF1330 family)